MIITNNEELKDQKHDFYSDFKLQQTTFIFEDKAEKIVVTTFDKEGKQITTKIYQPEFINTHINITFQDKGVKSDESLYEMVKVLKNEQEQALPDK